MEEGNIETGKKRMVFKTKPTHRQQPVEPLGEPWKIIVVDDDRHIHFLTEEVLRDFTFEKRPLQLVSGYSGEEAIQLLRIHGDAAAVLLDVIMESNTSGLDVVRFIREELGNRRVRILLRTGQAGQFPEEKIFEEYDINNFLEKSDLTSRRLKTAIKVALRAHRDMCALDEARQREHELRQAADAASQAKTNFLHMMSHELRTPLQGTKGPFEEFTTQFHLFSGVRKLQSLIESLDDSVVTARFSEALREVGAEVGEIAAQGLKSVEHLLGLIEDILDFARIEAGKLLIDPVPLSVSGVIGDVVAIVSPMVEKRGLSLTVDLGDGEAVILADEKRFKQILFNLLGNALKFTVQGGIGLTLLGESSRIGFRIADTGIGIPRDKFEVIFQPFEQVDNASTRRAGGTGLGLPITRELVRRQGGDIKVESELGKGSVFTFWLPRVSMEGKGS
ncbi:MAG: hypothetical protein HQL76_13175 [Magnetococcales bacterium]|nr:hypothetical protein [Magnetococcales bacterium]